MKGTKAVSFQTNPPDIQFVIVLADGSAIPMAAKTPHNAIAMFQRQNPLLADQVRAVGQESVATFGYRGICRRCEHVILAREDERPVNGPHGGLHSGECGANSRMNLTAATVGN